MNEQKVLDKFNTLYQQDTTRDLLEAAQMEAPPEQTQPAGEQPTQPEQPAQEGGKPAEMGDFGTALKNIEGFAPIPGAEAVKSAIEPEPQKSFKDMGFMEKLKAIPGEAMKVLRQDVAGSIPTTVGQAALMGATGKVLKEVGAGIKAAGQAFHELPKPVEVKARIEIRSAGDSKVAKEEYGGAIPPEPAKPVEPEPSQLGLPLTEEKPKVEGIPSKREMDRKVEAERKAQGSRIVTPNDVSRTLGRELFANETEALEAKNFPDGASYVFGLADKAEGVEARLLDLVERFRGGDTSVEQDINSTLETVIQFRAKIKNSLEELARGLQTGSQDDVKAFTKRWDIFKAQQEQLESVQPFLAEQEKATRKGPSIPIPEGQTGPIKPTRLTELGKPLTLTSEEMPGMAQPSGTKAIPERSKEFVGPKQPQERQTQQRIPLSGTQIARLIDTLGKKRAIKAIENADRYGWDMLTSHIYFAQLSNPRTWQVNTGVSTFLMPLYQAASIGLGSRLKPKLLAENAIQAGELARYYPGAGEAHLVGALDGFNTAIRHIIDSWNGGGIRGLFTDLRNLQPLERSTMESLSPTNKGPAISSANLNRFFANHEKLSWAQFDPNGVFKPAAQLLDAYGEGAHFVRQMMEAGDKMAYLVNEHAHRGSQAFSRGVELGLKDEQLIKYYKAQITTPTLWSQVAAQKGGMHDIFREEVTGTTGSIVRGLGHPMWRVPITYVRTPLNIASIGLEGFPGLNRLVSHVRGDYEAGGARAQLATGRWMVSSLIAGTAATMAVGNRLTGYGPLDPQGREAWLATHEPYAFRIRDTGDKKRDWISYKFLQPFSTWMGMVADFTQMKAIEHTPEKAMEYMWAPVVAFQHSLSNTIFTEDLFRLMDALHIRPHQNQEQWAQSVSKYLENRAKSVIPPASAGLKALYSAIDPVSKEIVGIGDALKAGIPGWSSTMKPDLDYFGQEQKYGAAYNMLMTPIRETDTKYDKVTNEIARNQPNLLNIPSIVDKTELTSTDKYNFKNIRGNEVKLFGGKKFGEALLSLVESEKYQKGTEGPHGMRAKLLSTYVGAYTKAAIAQMAKKDPRFYNMLSEFENMDELTGKKVQRPGIFRMQPQ